MPNAPIRILIVAALCIAALIGLVVRESMARDGGQEVQLAMGAIDPRALLQGHYVIVALQDRLANEAPCPASLQHGVEGDPRHHWLALSPNGPRHTINGQAASREEAMRLGALAADHFPERSLERKAVAAVAAYLKVLLDVFDGGLRPFTIEVIV